MAPAPASAQSRAQRNTPTVAVPLHIARRIIHDHQRIVSTHSRLIDSHQRIMARLPPHHWRDTVSAVLLGNLIFFLIFVFVTLKWDSLRFFLTAISNAWTRDAQHKLTMKLLGDMVKMPPVPAGMLLHLGMLSAVVSFASLFARRPLFVVICLVVLVAIVVGAEGRDMQGNTLWTGREYLANRYRENVKDGYLNFWAGYRENVKDGYLNLWRVDL